VTTTLVIGASGRTGALIVAALLASGQEVIGTVRRHEYLEALHKIGATSALIDLMTATTDELRGLMAGVDAVVYSAGSSWGSSREIVSEIDGRAIGRAADAAASAGVTRFVLISAHRADEDFGDDTVLHLLRAKRAADAHVRGTMLLWTIIRPDALTEGPPTGRVTAGPRVPHGSLARADLAALVQVALDHDLAGGRQFEVVGGNEDLFTALASL
jgi:uncharacterized protein YbjT (DUF2867 family)